jgi:hypothetical protein
MSPAQVATPLSDPKDSPNPAHFQIFRDDHGHWCARKDDGMIAGTFFDRRAALHFAQRESR